MDFNKLMNVQVLKLFYTVEADDNHVLHKLLPRLSLHSYELRGSHSKYMLPELRGAHDIRNFILFMVYNLTL